MSCMKSGNRRPHLRCVGSPAKHPRRKAEILFLSNLKNSKDNRSQRIQWVGKEKPFLVLTVIEVTTCPFERSAVETVVPKRVKTYHHIRL